MRFVTIKLKYLAVAAAFLALIVVSAFTAYAADAAEAYWSGARSLPIYSVGREDKKISI